ncbi:MAG: fluoride efflux transporter CrcB [Pigmentiphaga sp.]|nr:fluoride efflux transporter CrcB [Pigmentiphaga sp.]
MPSLTTSLLAIAVGAVLGAWSRWGLSLWLNNSQSLPWGTLAANGIGAYVIGLLLGWAAFAPHWPEWLRLATITGFLGALTTFSTFSAEVVGLLQQGRSMAAFTYLALSVAGSLSLTAAGLASVHFLRA